MTDSIPSRWGIRNVLRAIAGDLARAWWRLAALDLVVRAITFAIATPLVGIALGWFLRAGGGTGVVTDFAIVLFFLSPVGVLTLLIVGSLSAALYFAETGALQLIAVGNILQRRIWPVGALQILVPRLRALVRLALAALLRLLPVAAPALGLAGLVYWLLLTEYDLYFYLNVRPTEYWVALVLILTIIGGAALLILRRLVSWSFAIPILLLEEADPVEALRESSNRSRTRVRALVGWHIGWVVGGVLLGALSTGAIGLVGRALIRPDASLVAVAAGTGVVALVGLATQLLAAVLFTSVYAVLIARLYWPLRPASAPEGPLDRLGARHDVRWQALRSRLGWVLGLSVAVGVVGLTLGLLNRAGVEPAADVTAHRGAKFEAPENTMPAFERAIQAGADWIELDVQLTADNELIVVHDRDFNRVSGSALRAEESPLADLLALDVGSWFGPEFQGVTPPTLEEALETARDRVGVLIELKYFGPDRGLAPRVIETVEALDMADQVMLMSFEHTRIAEASVLRPDWEMGVLVAVTLGDALRLEADFYAVPPSLATRGFIRSAQRLGRDVHVWTVEDPVRISAMLSRGADNLYTGSASTVRRVIRERAALGPLERLLIDIAADLGIVRLPPPTPSERGDA
ncbi:MAG: glycerophosphodiester phosphodiesterase family protein [Gemmatimonadota bacterium]|nr:glycerophosphodiester phosphodiesterase family protein [Gemmatimonadota bacterium]